MSRSKIFEYGDIVFLEEDGIVKKAEFCEHWEYNSAYVKIRGVSVMVSVDRLFPSEGSLLSEKIATKKKEICHIESLVQRIPLLEYEISVIEKRLRRGGDQI